jgi:hypothetical protein
VVPGRPARVGLDSAVRVSRIADHGGTETGAREVADRHGDEPDVVHQCRLQASWSAHHAAELGPFVQQYGEHADGEPERLYSAIFRGTCQGALALLRDLHDLYLMMTECELSWVLVRQAAAGLRDSELLDLVGRCDGDTSRQLKWLRTRMKQAAPQALVVA